MFINNTIVNNFVLSNAAIEALQNNYLIPTCAFKPMHKVFNKTNDSVARIAIFILTKRVRREQHIFNVCHSNYVSDKEIGCEPDIGEVTIPLLHIVVEPLRFRIEPIPKLFYTLVFHGRKKEHYSGDGIPSGKILCEIHGASAIRSLYSAYLWTDSEYFKNHPRFIVYPDRMGKIEIKY